MNPEPSTLSAYNSVWRKLRRRCLVPRFTLFLWLLLLPIALIPAFCVVATMLRDHGWGWLVNITRTLWLMELTFVLLAQLLIQRFRRKKGQIQEQSRTASTLLSPLSSIVTLGALLLGRVDIAVYVTYGWATVSALTRCRKDVLASAVTILINVILLAGFATGSLWIVLLMLPLGLAWQFRLSSSLESLRKKPSQTAFLAKAREACAAGGG